MSVYLYDMIQKYCVKTDNEKSNNYKYNKSKSVYTFKDRGVSGKNMFLLRNPYVSV